MLTSHGQNKMKLDELFGFLKKKEEPEMGTNQERKAVATKMIDVFLQMNPENVKHSSVSATVRKFIGRDSLNPIDVAQNDIMRDSIIRTITNSETPIDQMEEMISDMEKSVQER
jgi:hypothetical protein